MRYEGSSGAITKSYRPSVSELIARKAARNVIDLTQESEEEKGEAGRESEAETEEESEEQQDSELHCGFEEQEGSEDSEESEESEESEGEDSEGFPDFGDGRLSEDENSDAESQVSSVQEAERFQRLLAMQVTPGVSYSVTRHRHRPWGGEDEIDMVGIFNTEEEAKQAALDDYMDTFEAEADGWEFCWWGEPGDEKIQLRAHTEDFEPQQDTYRGIINRIHHKEKPSELVPVYIVQEGRRKVDSGFYNELDSLIAARAHHIYREGLAANGAAQEIYESYLLGLRNAKTIKHETRHGLLSIILEDRDKQMSYSITVEERQLF